MTTPRWRQAYDIVERQATPRIEQVDFVETLPVNPSDQILKRDLREPYWAGVERGVH